MSRPLPRFTEAAIAHDPLEQHIAAMQRREAEAVAAVNAGVCVDANPQDMRGIPIIGRGSSGTSPGTNPWYEIDKLDPHDQIDRDDVFRAREIVWNPTGLCQDVDDAADTTAECDSTEPA